MLVKTRRHEPSECRLTGKPPRLGRGNFESSNLSTLTDSKEIILAEIAKCDVPCANCHLKEHWQERMDQGLSRISPKYQAAEEISTQVRGVTVA